ncbi:MAG: SiaB family protein kinase [Thermonemataceae bacterium]|nr:SiaB family protein kinase [Thermonemataceae bacterium]
MSMKYVYELHKTMIANNLIIVYEGEFTQEITKSVLAMAERNMDAIGESANVKRKVFNVMVECLQNIVKHAEDLNEKDEDGLKNNAIFMLGKQINEYIVTSGNPIRNDIVPKLKAKIEQINALDKEGLKSLYKEIIKNTEISEKGGAGLGFVDMARKSGEKLGFSFEPINDEFSFFALRIVVSRDNA